MYGINCSSDEVIVLKSSTELKISFHLVFKSVVFPNNRSCKDFVQFVLEKLSPADRLMLCAFDSSIQPVGVIDMTVYSRNQNFRLVQSSKFGKDSPLTLVDKNFDVKNEFDKESFLDTLVCDKLLIVNTVIHDESPSIKEPPIKRSMATLQTKFSSNQKNN